MDESGQRKGERLAFGCVAGMFWDAGLGWFRLGKSGQRLYTHGIAAAAGEETLMEHTERVHEEERTKPPEDADGRADGSTPGATKRKGKTIEEILAEHAKGVPQEEWDKLPPDLSFNLDHYIAGAKKKVAERPKRPIEEILKEHARRVPPEEWAKLPDDLIDRLDHYTSGADV